MKRNEIFCGDWKEAARQLKPGSIDCIITSPPYYGLRDYGVAGQCGNEETPEQYISNLVEGFRLLRVALKDCGTLWINIGDSYAASGKNRTEEQATGKTGLRSGISSQTASLKQQNKIVGDLKPKDLIGIPWMLAFALRADGWYLRQDIIWNKPNTMPESVTDRCTKSHEYIFLLSKSKTYYFDAEAIKEDGAAYEIERRKREKAKGFGGKRNLKANGHETGQAPQSEGGAVRDLAKAIDLALTGKRNKRSVWTVTTKPFKDAHFACYPHELIDPCILAGTSEKGCCPKCGGPWSRIVEPVFNVGHDGEINGSYPEGSTAKRLALLRQAAREQGMEYNGEKKTIGWEPTCKCGLTETVPAIVYDPFMGSGTTASAAKSLGRDYMGSELNPDYMKIEARRLHKELGLFNQK